MHQGKAYLCVVIADLQHMRPYPLWPKALGFDFSQVVYRAIVRNASGERGVYFVRSDADSKLMCVGGNLMSNFRFNCAELEWDHHASSADVGKFRDSPMDTKGIHSLESLAPEPHGSTAKFQCRSSQANIDVTFDLATRHREPLADFETFEDAQAYFVELYCAYAEHPRGLRRVRIKRSPWPSCLVNTVGDSSFQFMKKSSLFNQELCKLHSIFYVQNLEYHWFRGDFLPFAE